MFFRVISLFNELQFVRKRVCKICDFRLPASLVCKCDSGVARCQSQYQCHIWRMNTMFDANCTASELGSCQSNVSFIRL